MAELELCLELARNISTRGRELGHLARDLRRAIVFVGRPQSSRAAQHDVELQMWLADRFRQRVELGKSFQPLGRPPEHLQRLIANAQQRQPVRGTGDDRQGKLDQPEGLLRRVGIERRARGRKRQLARALCISGRERVVHDQCKASGRRLARRHQHVDDRAVNGAALRRGQRRGGELADLFVCEAEVGRRRRRMLHEQSGRDGRHQKVAEV